MRLHEMEIRRFLGEFGQPGAAQPAMPQPGGAPAGPTGAPMAQPAPPMQQPPAKKPDDHEDDHKIDPKLMALLKNEPYVTDFRHDDDSKIHPDRVASMGLRELHDLKDKARVKAQRREFTTNVGLYKDDDYAFYQALIRFVNKIVEYKQGDKGAK